MSPYSPTNVSKNCALEYFSICDGDHKRLSFVNRLRKSGDNRIEQIDKMVYHIERELENLQEVGLNLRDAEFDEFREEAYQKLRRARDNRTKLNYRNLDEILYELRDLSSIPILLEIETFGEEDEILNWDRIKNLSFRKSSSQYPISKISVEDGFEYKSSNNFLSRIWLEFIGDRQIPFDIKQREDLISEIENKFSIKRHIDHWKHVAGEKSSKQL